MILRRGATFTVDVHTSTPPVAGDITASLSYQAPTEAGNKFVVQKWKVDIVSKGEEADETVVKINIPGNAPIGFYELSISFKKSPPSVSRLVVLLNPWSSEDSTYLNNEDSLKEYVLNERGIIWVGSSNDYEGKVWAFEQFEGANLETALSVLYEPPIGSAAAAADVTQLSRHISWVTADQICRGKWGQGPYDKGGEDGEYGCSKSEFFPGTRVVRNCWAPWSVHNVSLLLNQYAQTKVSTQYCQCFVFAAIMNAVGRSLGLPTRAVTNFNSAADHDDNGIVDKYYEVDEKGFLRPVDEGEDSVWNFHVWNEAFFARPPVKGFDISGWQAFDGTPQILSGGKYRVGPASLKAVWAEKKEIQYDVQFLMAESNAAVNTWIKKGKGAKFELQGTKRNPLDPDRAIGKKMSSKKPGPISQACYAPGRNVKARCEGERDDLTRNYKNVSAPGSGLFYKRNVQEGLEVELIFPDVRNKQVFAGENVKYGFSIVNTREEDVSIHVSFDVRATEYTDEILFQVADVFKTATIPAGKSFQLTDVIKPFQYSGLFTGQLKDEDMGFLRFDLTATVDDEDTFFAFEKHLFLHVEEDEEQRYFK
eukprot:TRINITY_DN1052_c0_g1_i2.p1 TRINITY_DN1052_c0_g1~~TRINITY_DN1052_c0_g1_i2.p1  ORF type:complete len:679 (-),score=265.13 TRINITY_DN1052_c0_g1_i2:99-1877(-)